jgi:RNA polymerase sigma-70 factor (ECF subfamily)
MTEDRRGGPDDVALVRELVDGSFDALATLYDRHAAAVFAVATRLTSDRGVAEEVVQDTFLALWDRADAYDASAGTLGTWLHAIARNRTIDRLRAAGRRPRLVAPSGADDIDASPSAALDRAASSGVIVAGSVPVTGPEAAYASVETRAAIEEALGGLAVEERTVIVLAYREELSQSEIAERLGWPLGTVKTRTRRALRRLRDALDDTTALPAPAGEDG